MPHIFVRHGEMLGMKWADINFKDRVWKYEVGKTKNSGVKEHTVFLSEQVLKILKRLLTIKKIYSIVQVVNQNRYLKLP